MDQSETLAPSRADPAADAPLNVMISKLSRRASLTPADMDAIQALPVSVRTLESATYLVREGDPPDMCSVLISGFVYRQKSTGNGDRQIMGVHIPGDLLDLHNLYLDLADHSVQMLTRGDVGFITRARMQALMAERPNVARALMIDLMCDASILREGVLNIGRRNSRTRLAHLLCEVAMRLEAQGLAGEGGYELPMTQEQLADALALTPVHVNRTLKSLADDGLITRSKRQVTFPDYERLREVGDFNPRYLHLQHQRTGALAE